MMGEVIDARHKFLQRRREHKKATSPEALRLARLKEALANRKK